MIEEEEYFRVIEEYFLQKRGNPMLLSPKEWALIGQWFEAEIPMEVVLRAIDRAFEKKKDEDKQPTRLQYCRRLVKSEQKRYLKSLEGTGAPVNTAPEAQNVSQFLEQLVHSLIESSRLAREAENTALANLLDEKKTVLEKDVVRPFQENQSTDLQRVEHQLSTIEKEIEQLLLQSISEKQMDRFKEDAMRELKTFEEKVDLQVYQEMIRRSLIKSIRKLYNIPRFSLVYM